LAASLQKGGHVSTKVFLFSIVEQLGAGHLDARPAGAWRFSAQGETLDGALRAGLAAGASPFASRQTLRLFRFRFQNTRTGEFSALIGQGCDVAAAWADALKVTREQFRPKNDGRQRPANGISVLLAADRLPDYRRRVVQRSVENFESEAPFDPEKEPQEMPPPQCGPANYLDRPRAQRTFAELAEPEAAAAAAGEGQEARGDGADAEEELVLS
jgi:hypothetical protein